MVVRTSLRHRKLLFQDAVYISPLELKNLPPSHRPEIIRTVRRLSYARVLNAWRAHMNKTKTTQ